MGIWGYRGYRSSIGAIGGLGSRCILLMRLMRLVKFVKSINIFCCDIYCEREVVVYSKNGCKDLFQCRKQFPVNCQSGWR